MNAMGHDANARILKVEDLNVTYSQRGQSTYAVRGLSFDLYQGECLAIVGESGSGKSTTGLALMGLLSRNAGIEVGGSVHLTRKDGNICNILTLPERELRRLRGNDIAMIFQEPMSSLNPVYTVGNQIVEAILEHERVRPALARERAIDLLAELGIPEPALCFNRYPHELSGGMRQRVMIAIALSGSPKLLIADEPTTALDVTIQAQILELLQRIQAQTGMSVIFVTHNLGVVSEIAHRAIVMYAGEIVEAMPVSTLFDQTCMPYTTALLRSVPRLGRPRRPGQKLETIPGTSPNLSSLPVGCAFHPRCNDFEPGRCDIARPVLERAGANHLVRCTRWQELSRKEIA